LWPLVLPIGIVHKRLRRSLAPVVTGCISEFTAIMDDHRTSGLAIWRPLLLHNFDNIHSLDDPAKDDMLAIKMWRFLCAKEEL